MKKKITTVRIRADGTLVSVESDGREVPLSVEPIPDLSEAETEAGAASDPDNPPITPERRMRLRRVPRVKTLRRALALTQEKFAARYQIPLGTLRDWEQGRTEPDQPARAYLTVIARDPEGVPRALESRPAPSV